MQHENRSAHFIQRLIFRLFLEISLNCFVLHLTMAFRNSYLDSLSNFLKIQLGNKLVILPERVKEKVNFLLQKSYHIFHRENELPACVQIAQKGANSHRFFKFSKTHVGFTTLCAGNMAIFR